jgi:hypothetical protein
MSHDTGDVNGDLNFTNKAAWIGVGAYVLLIVLCICVFS